MSINATEAIRMAESGLPILALAPGSKKPRRGSHGVSEATCDTATIAQWWDCTPNANVGLACGQLFDVLDIDVRKGGRWPARQTIPLYAIARTPSGGWHLYVPVGWLADRTMRGEGWDYQAKGAYVVAPPSPEYEWIMGWRSEAEVTTLPDLP